MTGLDSLLAALRAHGVSRIVIELGDPPPPAPLEPEPKPRRSQNPFEPPDDAPAAKVTTTALAPRTRSPFIPTRRGT